MNRNRKNILLKSYLFGFFLILFGIGIVYNLINLQANPNQRQRFQEFAQKTNFRTVEVKAPRGNLYATDGSLLATTVRYYDIGLDAKSMRKELIDSSLSALADSLSNMFGKPSSYYTKLILNAKAKGSQYKPIAKKLNFKDMKRVSQFPIFKEGQIKGGFVVDDRLIRERSIRDIGARTIGYVRGDSIEVGLEGAYNKLLAGKNGQRLEQRMGGGNWRPINIYNEIEAEEGYDVVTTIDITLQNVAYNALYNQLKKYEAHHGSVVVMEVATGEIKAISNLTRMDNGDYVDVQNFAVGEANEPGSTIKTVSLLAALHAEKVDTSSVVNVRGREYLYGRPITDGRAYGNINVKKVLEKSSNIGTAKIITKHWQSNPKEFLKIINNEWKLNQTLGVDIPGEATPFISNPESKSWSKQSLSSLSFGYECTLTPLQILTFYNGIANDGVMLKPLFVKEIRSKGELVEKFEPQVRVQKMANLSNIKKMQNMLAGVVKSGTGRRVYIEEYPAAGKTGTARAGYSAGSNSWEYNSSFAGYFPADNPKYSCIVTVNKPKKSIGYYASLVAAPVFKEIMQKVYVSSPKLYKSEKPESTFKVAKQQPFRLDSNQKTIPNLIGKRGYEVITELENLGIKVSYTGAGKVVSQSVSAGSKIIKNQKIHLELEKT